MNIARCHLTVLGLLFTSRLTSVLAFFLKTHQFPLQNNKYWHQEYDQAESLPDQKHSPRPTDPSLLFITKVPKTGSITIRGILLKFCATRRPNIGCWFPGLSSSTNRSRQHTFYEQARLTVPDPKPFNIFSAKQKALVRKIRKKAPGHPFIYGQEIHLIDFEAVDGGTNPMFFGMMREPFDRFKSKWQHARRRG